MSKHKIFLSLLLAAAVAACEKPAGNENGQGQQQEQDPQEQDPQGQDPQGEGEGGQDKDPVVIDGKVTFNIILPEDSPLPGTKASGSYRIRVNDKEYPVQTADGKPASVTADESAQGIYNAVLFTANASVGQLPLGQIHSAAASLIDSYPLFASYVKGDSNNLRFTLPVSVLDIRLKGEASITSIKVENPAGGTSAGSAISGKAFWSFTSGGFNMEEGAPLAVLNCTGDKGGTQLTQAGMDFSIVIAPGNYGKGLELTICDSSHGVMKTSLPATELAAGETLTIEKDYTPDPDIVFYEGFDNCVWGGNYLGGANTYARSALSSAPGTTGGASLTGTEQASFAVECDTPGTGYIQSNTWDEVKGYNLRTSHRMTEQYLTSRGFMDYIYLFRCQEYQGCIGIGTANTNRGILRTAPFAGVKGIINAEVSIDFCLKEDFNDELQVYINHAGYVTAASIDGKTIDASHISYNQADATVQVPLSMMSKPGSAKEKKTCHTIMLTVDKVTNGSTVYVTSASSSSGRHGIFVDSITARKTSEMQRGTLRVLYWNIQNGMWADEANSYDNFVAFVKRYDPDVCVWCESATIYKTNTGTSLGNSGSTYKGYLPGGWGALAGRYGHSYTAVGGARDNYPQTVTSKYPITTLLKITNGETSSKPISHGAGLHRINVGGKDINIVTLHTWPQSYGYGVATANRDASTAAAEGDKYRQYEMNFIVSKTVNASAYASQQEWLMMGDFNSRSRVDEWHYNYGAGSTKYLCQDVVLDKTGLVDIIAGKYPGVFVSSTYGNSRIDYMYASPSMYSCVRNAMMLNDAFNIQYPDREHNTGFYYPSDHRPILVDFEF